MNYINQWVMRFQSLDPENQLKIAEAIIEELRLNDESLDDDEYDKNKSQSLEHLFSLYINQASSVVELARLQELLNRFSNYSNTEKEAFIRETFDNLTNYCALIDKRKLDEQKEQERKEKREFCQINGHSFSKWKKKKWTSQEPFGPSGIEALYTGVGTTEVGHFEWTRRCSHCGYVEKSRVKPDEVKAAEINKQIKVLQKSLDNLNNPQN